MLTLGELLRRSARPETHGSRIALVCRGQRVTYAEVNRQANRIAHVLLREGLKRGDRVAVLGRNSPHYACIIFGLAKAGAIMVPVNIWYRPEEIAYVANQSRCRFFLVQGAFRGVVEAARPKLETVERYLAFEGDRSDPDELSRLVAGAPDGEPSVTVAEDDPRVIMYTSGTTGFPKGATLTHRQHYLHALVYAHEMGLTERDRALLIYPLFHTGGADCVLVPCFLVGATVIVLDRPDPEEILDAIACERATFVFCVPTVWRRVLRVMDTRTVDVSSVRVCVSASDTIRREELEAIQARFRVPVTQIYGLTEAGPISHVLKPEYATTKLGSVGRPHPLVDVRIVDDRGQDVPPGEVGEVTMRGETIMWGYWEMPEKTAETIRDGWLYSGDLGRVDEDGFLFLMGRKKDMIISGGENVYPAEVERVLKEHPGIREVAVVGIPDPEWGESVLAVVVAEEGWRLTDRDVIEFARSRLAGFKRPRFVEFVDALPTTGATGKVQKAELRRRYGDLTGRR